MIAAAVTFGVVGLLFIVFLTLDVGHFASKVAHRHAESNREHPRFYALTDPLHVSGRLVYWRFYGGVFGAIALIIAISLLLFGRS
jgi:hypothetical protein